MLGVAEETVSAALAVEEGEAARPARFCRDRVLTRLPVELPCRAAMAVPVERVVLAVLGVKGVKAGVVEAAGRAYRG